MRDTVTDTVSATASTLLTKALVHPIDTLKTRIQSHAFHTWRDFFDFWRGRWKWQVYNGVGAKLAMYLPYQTLYMGLYTSTHNAWNGTVVSTAVVSAVAADLGSSPLRVPMEAVKIRLQSNVAPNIRAAVGGLRVCDARRLFVAQTIVHDVPYSVVQWVCYEWWRDSGVGGTIQPFIAGTVCGGITAVVTCPADVVKTRVLMGGGSVRSVALDIVRHEGIRRLWRGVGIRVLWVSANSGLFFGLFENVRGAVSEWN